MTLQEGQVLSFLIDAEGKTLEIHADDLHSTEEKPGDVYAARVEKVMPGLGAAFICYAPGKTGYITASFKSQGMSGHQMKEVIVASNTQPARTRLRISATVR